MKTRMLRFVPLLLMTISCQQAFADTVNARFPKRARSPDDVFTRMFPDLPPFAAQTDSVRNVVKELGAKDGLLDAGDDLSDPVQSLANQPVFSPNNRDNPRMTAGMTFLGQFLDHDITLDLKSQLMANADPARTTNFRTAAFDLDSVYGDGPDKSPELYDTSTGDIKLLVQPIRGSEAVSRKGALRYDLPRYVNGDAIVGDSRNDENVILSQLHVAMLRFHNTVTDELRADPRNRWKSPRQIFEEARRLVRWHYQWCIVHEFLPLTIGQDRIERIMREGLKYYPINDTRGSRRFRNRHDAPLIPVEFSVAAYRFGHSQVRPSYRLNFGPDGGQAFFAFVFDDNQDPASSDPDDLRGGKRAPRRFVDWQTFFDFGDGNSRPNKRIDTHISSPLMHLLGSRGPAPGMPTDGVQSLAARNLIRHVNFGLPSGQAIAARMGVPALTPAQLSELAPYDMDESTPLWYYVLKEAEVMEDGLRLGPVGARIVGEVFIGLLLADRSSYLSTRPRWRPTLASAYGRGQYRIADILRTAGVVPPL
ncbi:MAG: peroxidase [Gammaproteobacteria bacterium]|nr:peroxidase [Gammaproteobacteria bacterium]